MKGSSVCRHSVGRVGMSSESRFSDRGSAVVGFASAQSESLSQLLFPTSTVVVLTSMRSSMFNGGQSL